MDVVTADHAAVAEANRKYHDAYVGAYESTTHAGMPHYGRHVRGHLHAIMAALPKPPGDSLALDAGAGAGFFTRILLEEGFHVHAAEISEGMRKELAVRCVRFPDLRILDVDIVELLSNPDSR